MQIANQNTLTNLLYSVRFMHNISWVYDNPRVALLNIGEEEGKGNLLAQATYPLLKENKAINFIGNIEGRDVLHR